MDTLYFLLGILAAIFFLVTLFGTGMTSGYGSAEQTIEKVSKPPHESTIDQQLSALQATTIAVQRPINSSAFRVLLCIEQAIKSHAPSFRVLAEVGMGSFLRTTRHGDLLPVDKQAFGAFNSKRVDFLIIDGKGHPAFAVEFQGSGHHLGSTAAARDAVKKEALRLAGIELVEIHDYQTDEERSALIAGAIRRAAAGAADPSASAPSQAVGLSKLGKLRLSSITSAR